MQIFHNRDVTTTVLSRIIRTVGYEAAEITTNDAMPSRALPLIKLTNTQSVLFFIS